MNNHNMINNMNNNNFPINTNNNNGNTNNKKIINAKIEPIYFIKEANNSNEIKTIGLMCESAIIQNLKNPNPSFDFIANTISENLKQSFKDSHRVWFVLVSENNETDFDFKFTEIDLKKLIIYRYNNLHIYVCSLKI